MVKVEVHSAVLLGGSGLLLLLGLLVAFPAEPNPESPPPPTTSALDASILFDGSLTAPSSLAIADWYVACADRPPVPGETLCIDLMVEFPLTHVLCFDVPDDPDTLGRVCGTIGEFRAALAAVVK